MLCRLFDDRKYMDIYLYLNVCIVNNTNTLLYTSTFHWYQKLKNYKKKKNPGHMVTLKKTFTSYVIIFIKRNQGSHPTWKTRNFVIFFCRPGIYLEFAQKVVKIENFNSKPGQKLKFANSMHHNCSRCHL